jgi:hypothetical protein
MSIVERPLEKVPPVAPKVNRVMTPFGSWAAQLRPMVCPAGAGFDDGVIESGIAHWFPIPHPAEAGGGDQN